MKIFLSLIAAVLLTSCSLLPSHKTESQSLKTSESLKASQSETLRRITTGTPAPSRDVKVGGLLNRVELKSDPIPPGVAYTSAAPVVAVQLPRDEINYRSSLNTDADSDSAAKGKFSMSIPVGVSLLLAAAGILAVLFAIKRVRQSSAAVDVAMSAADQALKGRIQAFRDRAMLSTDPHEIAAANAHIASLEADRGKLAANG